MCKEVCYLKDQKLRGAEFACEMGRGSGDARRGLRKCGVGC